MKPAIWKNEAGFFKGELPVVSRGFFIDIIFYVDILAFYVREKTK